MTRSNWAGNTRFCRIPRQLRRDLVSDARAVRTQYRQALRPTATAKHHAE